MSTAEMVRVAIQGEPGSFSEEAARRMVRSAAVSGFRTFDEVAASVAAGAADFGVLPAANSLLGPVVDLPGLLNEYGLAVVQKLSLPIAHCLIAARALPLEAIQEVRSHPVALRQCRRFLERHPWMTPVPTADTAGAVREVCSEGRANLAAIAGAAAARVYGGTVLVEGIADSRENFTRFVLVERRR